MKNVAGTIQRKTMLYETGVEYGDYTMNHVLGCSHGCKFPCYAFLQKKSGHPVHALFDSVCDCTAGRAVLLCLHERFGTVYADELHRLFHESEHRGHTVLQPRDRCSDDHRLRPAGVSARVHPCDQPLPREVGHRDDLRDADVDQFLTAHHGTEGGADLP